jgi:type IV pilus assembly protein PilB
MPPLTSKSLGEILVTVGIITPEQLKTALAQCDPAQRSLGPVLVSLGFATDQQISKAVSIRLNIPFFTTFEGFLDPAAARLLPEETARKLLVVPIFQDGNKLTLGMVNPADIDAIDQVSSVTGLRVQAVMTTLANMFETIQQVYGHKQAAPAPEARPEQGTAKPPAKAPQEMVIERTKEPVSPGGDSVIGAVNAMLQEGVSKRASDVHLEPAENVVRARFRVDGMLQDGKIFPKDLEAALIARIKLLARLDITETRLPQDGHIRFTYGGSNIDVRVSTLPTVHGEKVVMRLLDSSKALRKINELGIDPAILARFTEAIASPNGLILVTGPTGSGKTTTLYSAIATLNKPDRNIITLEDPVEYVIGRVNQMETFPKIGLNFATGLRAILRQDPNIILVGEIRDLETAEIAMQASITGHLVFSTLHTNDAVASVHRLLNMQVAPFMIAAALRGVLAQRLLRRLCPACKKPHTLTAKQLSDLGLSAGAACHEPVGCPACGNTGYAGRLPIHEWMPVTKAVRDLILEKASADALRAAATADGYRSMRRAALEQVELGETSVEEMLRVTREQIDA